MSAPNASNIVSGPAQVKLNTSEIGHTAGSLQATITPQNRPRVVDQFGSSEVAIIHTGDQVRLTIPFAEWAAATLAEVYEPGNDQTGSGSGSSGGYMGIGRSAGYVYTTQLAQIIPRLTTEAAKLLEFWKVTPIGELSLPFSAEDDRVFETEFACLVDESQTDGELIGKIQLN